MNKEKVLKKLIENYLYTRDDLLDLNDVEELRDDLTKLILDRFDGSTLDSTPLPDPSKEERK